MTIAGFSFGFILGYLSWRVFQPGFGGEKITFKNISSLIVVLLGTGILAVFRPGGEGFAGYGVGILFGFFITPGWHFLHGEIATSRDQRQKEYQEEIDRINSNWAGIDQVIQHKLKRKMRKNVKGITEAILPQHELNELQYSYEGILAIMQAYARNHIDQGVELKKHVVEKEDEEWEEEEVVYYLYQAITEPSPAGASIGISVPAKINTIYRLGNDDYQELVAIESPSGEILGECGVGILETIGGETPKKVTAFWVGLEDANDSETVYKMLMSSHAYSDEATRQRLAGKAELVLARTGRKAVLETESLQVVARIVEMSYGTDDVLKESFFDHMKVELEIRSAEPAPSP